MNKRQVYKLFFSDLRKAGIKMAEFIKAFLSVAIAGSFLGFIVPENKMSKPINFLISLVVIIGLFAIFGTISADFSLIQDYKKQNTNIYENNMANEAKTAISDELIEQIKKLAGSYGAEITDIKTEIIYENGEFNADSIIIYSDINDEQFLNYLKSKLKYSNISYADKS